MTTPGLNYSIHSGYHYYDNTTTFFDTAPLYNVPNNQGIAPEIPNLLVGTGGWLTTTYPFYNASVRWFGYFVADYTGTWTFNISSDDNSLIWLGYHATSGINTTQNAFIRVGPNEGGRNATSSIYLTAGVNYPILIHYGNGSESFYFNMFFYNNSGNYPTELSRSSGIGYFFTSGTFPSSNFVCFKEDTKILTENGYKVIQDLKKGELVQTLRNGFIPIDIIGKQEVYHVACDKRIKDQLYKYSVSDIPELIEDLVLTGCHSVLIDCFTDDEQRNETIAINGDTYVTNGKYRLPAVVDKRSSIYENEGKYTIYHLALENDNYYANYGIYANGLLVESCSKRYIKELSGMEIIQ
jgi:hypothetical protein